MLWMTAMWATQKVDDESLFQISKRFKVSEKVEYFFLLQFGSLSELKYLIYFQKYRMQLMMPKTIEESGISSIDFSIDIEVVTDIWKK